jgi:hypothetical protein
MWIEIFRSGEHKDSSGNTQSFSEYDIQEIADIYNAESVNSNNYSAPLVKGHPKTDSPAYAWVERLARRKNLLYAKLTNINDEISHEINSGRFKNVSIALYPNKLLKHVGLLGAAQPAVKGLSALQFADGYESNYYTLFQENQKLKNEIQNLKSITNDSKYYDFAEKMVSTNKIISPVNKDSLVDILKESATIKSNNSSLDEKIMEFIGGIANYDLTFSIPKVDTQEHNFTFSPNVDADRLEMHDATLKLMQNLPDLSYEEAATKAFSEFII